MTSLVLRRALAGAAPLFTALAIIWYGPENPAAEFGYGRASARIFNGGDAVLATSYLLLGLTSGAIALYLYLPLIAAPTLKRPLPPSRMALLRVWKAVRFLPLCLRMPQHTARPPVFGQSLAIGAS